jgi:hypothetical protein
MIGCIKVHRKLAGKAFYTKDSQKVHLWIHLLIRANHTGNEEMLGGNPIHCDPGQFTTGRKQLSMETGINESKIERILTYLEKTEQQIEQQKMSTNRLISIRNWDEYQMTEQQSEQRPNNDRTTSEQQVNNNRTHLKNVKKENNVKNEKEKDILIEKIKEDFYQSLTPFVEQYGSNTVREFYDYWSEPNKSNTKIKYQLEKTWDANLRLKRWVKNDFGKKKIEAKELTQKQQLDKLYKKV